MCSGLSARFCFDIFVTAYGPQGGARVWSTYLGGNDDEYAGDIALDGAGNLLVTGYTESINYPVTGGAFQTWRSVGDEGFVAKISPANRPPTGGNPQPDNPYRVYLPMARR